MADMVKSDMPLANELSVVNYLRNILGVSSSGTATAGQVGNTLQAVGGVSTPGVATASQAEELTQDQLSTIMTEWLRGNGQFLDNMRQQNVSGLYNTSTQKLVANDLTAQAALKAATANQEIQKANANLATQANIATSNQATQSSMASAQNQTSASQTNAQLAAQNAQLNARLSTDASLANAKSGANTSRTDSLINTALAALMNAYKSSGNKEAKGAKGTKNLNTSGITESNQDYSAFNDAFSTAQANTNFLLDSSYTPTTDITAPSYNYGLEAITAPAASNFDIPYTAPVDMGGFEAPTVMDFGQTSAASSYDFTPVNYTDSDFYGTSIGTPDYGSVGSPEDYTFTPDSGYIPGVSADDDEVMFNWSWSF